MGVQDTKLALFSLSLFHMHAGVSLSEVRLMSVNIYSPTKVRTNTHVDIAIML